MRRLFVSIAASIALAMACSLPSCSKGPLVAATTSARPGEIVHLHQDRGDFQDYHSLRATVGGEPARVSRVISNTDLDIVVPMLAPANVEVVLFEGSNSVATTSLEVLDTDCRRFVMRMDGNNVTILRIEPCFDTVDRDVATLDPRLSFDLVDAAGTVLYTASIPSPLETQSEVFTRANNEATIARKDPAGPAVFWVRLRNLPNARALIVYRVPAGVDIKSVGGRDDRVRADSLGVSIQ